MATFAHTSSIVLPVPPERWPPPRGGVRLDSLAFDPKRELHVTLVGTSLGRELQATLGAAAAARVGDARIALDWQFERGGRCLLLRKSFVEHGHVLVAHSIVEMIGLPAMAPFHRALGRLLGRQLPVPPPHVTLYTAGCARGIGVSSPARLRAFAVRSIAADELD
ncbi:MAG: hypothetical protein L0H23_01265 [Luteimonas sp.]|nr:hypothetical protein [Luteimonas sp.]